MADDRDGARRMTKLDGELSPPFRIVEPASWRAPIIFNSPHSGSTYPAEFLNASRIDLPALRRSEDSFMDELIGHLSERGFPVVTVNFPQGLNLPGNTWELRAASQLAGAGDIFNVVAHGADY